MLALPWLATWILAAPLFHLHALDAQEDRSLFQATLAHTVFTPDLPGEYSPRIAVHQSGTQGDQHTFSNHFPRYSEIAIGLFSENNAKRKNGTQHVLHTHFFFLERPSFESVRHVIPEFASPSFLLLASIVSSRAPPFRSC